MQSQEQTIIENTLKGLLNPNNEERRVAEQQLASLLNNKPSLVLFLSKYLLTSTETTLSLYALVIIRKILEEKGENEDISIIWANYDAQQKETLKNDFLQILKKNTDINLSNKICDIISIIYENCYNKSEKWNDILSYIIDAFKIEVNTQNFLIIQNALFLLSKIFNYATGELKEGEELFIVGFNNFFKCEFLKIKAYASQSICEILTGIIDKKFKKEFKNFIFYILQTILECFNKNDENNLKITLFALNDLAQVQPNVLNKNFSDIFTLMGKIFEKKDYDEESLRTIALEILLSIIDRNKTIIKNDHEKISILVNSILKYGMEIEDTIDEEWKTPKSLTIADESFIPEEKLDECVYLLDRYITGIGKQTALGIVSNSVMELLNHSNDNWKYKYIAYIVIGKMSEHVDDINQLDKVINTIFGDLNNENPKIRYSCLCCISQFSDNFKDGFTELYHNKCYPYLIQLFNKETVLRVKCQICDAFQSMLENTSKSTLNLYLQNLLDSIFTCFIKDENECCQLLRESILDTLGEITSTSKDDFIPYAEKCFSILFEYFKNLVTGNTSNINLFSLLVEIITNVGEYCTSAFENRAYDIAQTLILFQNSISNFKGDVGGYLETSWNRLIPIIKEKYKDILPNVIESIIKVISHPPEVSVASDPSKKIDIKQFVNEVNSKAKATSKTTIEKHKFNLNVSETEEYSMFLSLFNLFLQELKDYVYPFLNLAEQAGKKVLNYPNIEIRSEASKIFPLLIKAIETKVDQQTLINYIKDYLSFIITSTKNEKENCVIADFLNSIEDIIIGHNKIFTSDELTQLFNELLQIFDKTEFSRLSLLNEEDTAEQEIKAKKTNKKVDEDDDFDEDYEENNLDDIRDEIGEVEDVLVAYSDTVGSIFKTHKELSLNIAKKMLFDTLPKYLNDSSSNFEKKMGLFILDDMVEFLGQDLLHEVWDDIANILIKHSDNKISELRQAASYGLGQFVEQTNNNFEKYSQSILNAFERGLNLSSDGELEESFNSAQDNIVASLGRIIKFRGIIYGDNLKELINKWIQHLPIIADVQESIGMHDLLCDIILNSSNLAFGDNNCNLPKIIRILCTIVENKKYSNTSIDEKIFKIFTAIKNNSSFIPFIDEAKKMAKKSVIAKINKYLV